MPDIKVFISSVQAEFAKERQLLCDYIRQDESRKNVTPNVTPVRRDFEKLRETYDIEWIPLSPTTGYWEVKRK